MARITASLPTLKPERTAHTQGYKQVFLRDNDTPTKITQVAYGTFSKTDYCEPHVHATMEECFFFLKGAGIYTVSDEQIVVESGVFVRIPAGTIHRIECTSAKALEYVYFGVSINEQ